jgi:predicted N-acetyltransferase YhbS
VTAAGPLTVRHYQPDDEESVFRLQREALGESAGTRRTSAFWEWKHTENPFGRSFVRVAADPRGEVVGLRAFMQWQMVVGGQTVRAVEAVDTAVRPDHQRRGIFSTLTRLGVDDLRAAGIQLVFNTPNSRARAGYVKLGWRPAGMFTPLVYASDLPRLVGGMATARRRGAARAGDLDAFLLRPPAMSADAFDDAAALRRLLDADVRVDGRPSTETVRKGRSPDYLRWRYARHPNIDYHAHARSTSDGLQALAVYRTNVRFGLKEVLLCELFLAEQDPALCRSVLDELLGDLGADYVVAHLAEGSFHCTAVEGYGFRRVPAWAMKVGCETSLLGPRLSQKPRRLVVNVLDPALPADLLLGVRSWALSEGDLEF